MASGPDRRLALGVAAAGLVLAAGVIFSGAGEAKGPSRTDLERIAVDLDGRLREVAAGVHARAMTLSELPRLQAAVSTDAATVHDLTQDELAFQPRPGEVIEIAQLPSGGKPERLWKSEARDGAEKTPSPALDRFGPRLLVDNGALFVADVVEVKPRDRAGELTGAIALTWIVDLKSVRAALEELGAAGRLDAAGQSIALGEKSIRANELKVTLPLGSEIARGAALVAQAAGSAKSGAGLGRWAAAAAIALVGLIAAGLLGRGKPGAVLPPSEKSQGHRITPEPAVPVLGGRQAATEIADASEEGKTGTFGEAKPATRAVTNLGVDGAGSGAPARARIGRYTLLRILGSGGMADVHLARATGEAGFEKLVALKVLHRAVALQPAIVEHFLDEARLASHLTHPNIVQIIDLGRADDEYFIAMEYIDGADLDLLLSMVRSRGGLVPISIAFTIVRRVLEGLHAAHTAVGPDGNPLDLVHRDVKSANVFVAKNGAVKIGDFGIAQANRNQRARKTQAGQVKGTAAYMAPEHRAGKPVDARADLYAAGVIAYEVFTGMEVNLDLAVVGPLGREGWPHLRPASEVRPDLPASLDAVIFKALAYERDDRFPTCEAMEEALEQIATPLGLFAVDKRVAQWVTAELAASDGSTPPVPATPTPDRDPT